MRLNRFDPSSINVRGGGGGGFPGGIPAGIGGGYGGDYMSMIGGAGGGELMSMVPQLIRMVDVGGGRHGRRRTKR